MKNWILIFVAIFIAIGCGGGDSSNSYPDNLKITQTNKTDVLKSYISFKKYEYYNFYNELIFLNNLDLSSLGSHGCLSGNYSIDSINDIDSSTKEYIITFANCKTNGGNDNRNGKISLLKSPLSINLLILDDNGYKTIKSGVTRIYNKDSIISKECKSSACYINLINITEYSATHPFGTLKIKNYFFGQNYEDSTFKSSILFGKLYILNQNNWVDLKHKEPEELSSGSCPTIGKVKLYGSSGTRMYITYNSDGVDVKLGDNTNHYVDCTSLPSY